MLEIKLAWRRLCASPMYSLFTILSIAVGVGVPAVIYAGIAAMLWPPTGVASPDTLFFVSTTDARGRQAHGAISFADLGNLRALRSATVAATGDFFDILHLPTGSETARGEAISEEYVKLLGLSPTMGTWTASNAQSSAAPAMISFELWQTRFAGNPEVLGMPLKLGPGHFQVTAVAPKGFTGIRPPGHPPTSVWISLRDYEPRLSETRRSISSLSVSVLARLRSGASPSELNAELTTIGIALDRGATTLSQVPPQQVARNWRATTLSDAVAESMGGARPIAYLAFGLLAMVFVVACTNLANLTWARAVQRQEEFAVRRALGASSTRLSLTAVMESAVLTAGGAVAAYFLFRMLAVALTVDLPISEASMVRIEPAVTSDVLGFAVAGLIVALLIFGVEPAVHAATRTAGNHQEGGNAATPRRGTQRPFVRWQVAICTAFVFIAAVCGRAALEASWHDSGLPLDDLVLGHVDFSGYGRTEAASAAARGAVLASLKRRVGERRVALSTGMPFGVATPYAALTPIERPFRRNVAYGQSLVLGATPEIFGTLALEVTHGRALNDADDSAEVVHAVINARAAKELFGAQEPLGRQFHYQLSRTLDGQGGTIQTAGVIGVMRDTDVVHFGSRGGALIVVPLSREYRARLVVTANKADSPDFSSSELVNTVRVAAPSASMSRARSGWTGLASQHTLTRVAGLIAAMLGILTIVLTMVGLYAIQVQAVLARTREHGVRLALGASPAQLRTLVLRDALVPVVQGIAMAVIAGAAGRAALKAVIPFEFAVIDPVLFTLVPLPLLLVAAAAALLPANVAARVDPIVALRHL